MRILGKWIGCGVGARKPICGEAFDFNCSRARLVLFLFFNRLCCFLFIGQSRAYCFENLKPFVKAKKKKIFVVVCLVCLLWPTVVRQPRDFKKKKLLFLL